MRNDMLLALGATAATAAAATAERESLCVLEGGVVVGD